MILVFNQNERVAEYLAKKKAGNNYTDFQSIGFEKDGELVGGVIYDSYESGYRCAFAGAGEVGWLTRKTLGYMFDYPFNQLKVKVMIASTFSSNKAALRVLNGMGFKEKARIPDCSVEGDLIIFTIYREDCTYLKGNK